VKDIEDVEINIVPPFAHRRPEAARNSTIVAAQNLHWERDGAFTGRLWTDDQGGRRRARSPATRASHTVRRDRPERNRKIGAAVAAGLVLTVCIGETLAEREAGEMLSVLDRQIRRVRRHHRRAGRRAHPAYEPSGDWHRSNGDGGSGPGSARAHPPALRQWFGAPAADEYGRRQREPDNTKI
jgi:triosephosphate isomerase